MDASIGPRQNLCYLWRGGGRVEGSENSSLTCYPLVSKIGGGGLFITLINFHLFNFYFKIYFLDKVYLSYRLS